MSDHHRGELHGFSDASERAYAAVVYLRGTGPFGTTRTSLLVAKTEVALRNQPQSQDWNCVAPY